VYVTRVLEESPAARAGLGQGIQIVSIQGESLHGKDAGAVRTLFNANLRTGLNLQISRPDGSTALIELKEGPIYPLSSEKIELE
jgi:C-terminal processing protease CtpA/Prc